MDAQNPTTPPVEEPKDESKVSRKSWPWIVIGLTIACIKIYTDGKEKDKIIEQKNAQIISIYKDDVHEAREFTRLSEQLRLASEQLAKGVNDSIGAYNRQFGATEQPAKSRQEPTKK